MMGAIDPRLERPTSEAELIDGYRSVSPGDDDGSVAALVYAPPTPAPIADRARALGLVQATARGSRELAAGERAFVELLGEVRRLGEGETVYWLVGDYIPEGWQ